MGEQMTWVDWITFEVLYALGAVMFAVFITAGNYVADKYEEWQKNRPHWENDWD